MKFSSGERVRVYSANSDPRSGEVISTGAYREGNTDEKLLDIKLDCGDFIFAHPKQCRKLKQKPRPLVVNCTGMVKKLCANTGYITSHADELLPLIGKRVRIRVEEIL